jgi:hypothetical protein
MSSEASYTIDRESPLHGPVTAVRAKWRSVRHRDVIWLTVSTVALCTTRDGLSP